MRKSLRFLLSWIETLLLGLDLFSQFFIDPLLKKEAMQREREAVDSEFQVSAT